MTATVPGWAEIDWSRHVHDATVEGGRLRYADYGEGPPIVLVHGLGGCWQWWLENIPALGADHRVIALDLPGYGRSEVLEAGLDFDAYPRAVAGLLDVLGLDEVVLVGHSLGGLVATRFAVLFGERLDGLVLVDAGGVALSAGRLRILLAAFAGFNALFQRPGVSRAFARRPRLRRLMFSGATGDSRSLGGGLAAEIVPEMAAPGFLDGVRLGGTAASDPGSERIRTRTLLLWGDRDRILPVSGARALAATLPDAELVVFDRTGHCPMFERRDDFNREVERFASR